MAELLANWINNEVELSKHVDNFEQDFSNGYLFGELLKRYNQQDNLDDFSKKENRDSKINNFVLLEPTFRSLKLKFNAQLIDNIMKGKRGAALGLLCQLKMALEKVYAPLDTKTSDSKPAKKLNPGKEIYDDRAHDFFKRRLQELNVSQKNINLDSHQHKFEEIRMKQEAQAKREEEEEQEMQQRMKQDMRRAQIDKLQRNAGFMEEWLRKGIEDWKRNQTVKKEREKKQLEFEFKQTKNIEKFTMTQIKSAVNEVSDGIAEFENTLKKQGIDPDVPGSSASSQSKTRMTAQTSTLKFGKTNQTLGASILGTTDGKMKERGSRMSEATRKERERRRGKLTKALNNDILRDMENQTREEQYVERLKRQSKQEEELSYQIWRTQQCKNVIIENRKLREARYFKRKELDTLNANAREEEMLRTLDEQRNIDEESQMEREMDIRINNKQFARQKRAEKCAQMLNEIFEIANQAYILQQKSDSEEIDDRYWREWMKLFKNETPIRQSYIEGKPDPDEDDDEVVGQTRIEVDESTTAQSELTLDDEELTDYLKNQGQWKTSLVTDNKINLAELMTAGEPAGGKGAKGAPVEIKLDEAEMKIPDELPKNNILGDVVEQIIYLNYEGEKDIVKPDVPSHLPLKVSIIGRAFSGKKTQAQLLAEKYNLVQYHPYELINEALERAEEELEKIDDEHLEGKPDYQKASPKANKGEEQQPAEGEGEHQLPEEGEGQEGERPKDSKVERKHSNIHLLNKEPSIEVVEEGPNEQILDIQADFERHGSHDAAHPMPKQEKFEKLRRNIFRKIGKQIKDELLEGKEITETLVVDLLVSKIKSDFAYMTQAQIDQDIKKVIEREEEIKEQLKKASQIKGKSFKNAQPIDEQSLKQELEDLSKFTKYGWILVDFPTSAIQAHSLEAQLSGYLPSIDREICERNEKLKSACRIIEPSEKPNIRDTLIESGLDAVLWLETSREECRRRALGRRVDVLTENEYHIDDNPPPTTNAPLCERLMPVIEPERAEEVIPDKHLAFDKHTNRLQQWFSKFGYEVEDDESSKLELCHTIDGESANPQEVLNNIQVLDKILERKQTQWEGKREGFRQEIIQEKERIRLEAEAEKKAEEERKRKEEEDARRRAEREANGEPPEEEPVQEEPAKEEQKQPEEAKQEEQKQEPVPPAKDNIDDDFAPVLMKIWDEIEQKYITRMRKTFNLYRNQRERVVTGLSKTQKYFVQFLNRPDTKQAKLDQFVVDLNKFSDEYPDLREDDQTKEELHQRTDTLSDQLWEISEQRRDEAVDERKKIMENGWIEFELEQVTSMAQNLMQGEIDKFRNSVNLLQDYYYAIEDKLIPDPSENLNYELVTVNDEGVTEELPPVYEVKAGEGSEAKESYPRLDKLFEKALKAQILPEVEVTPPGGAAAGDKKAPPKGKDPKKAAAEEESQEKSFYDQELKQAIATEKAVLRFRLTMVRNWALNLMKELRNKSRIVYDKLNTWIEVAFKAETDAILEQEKVIKLAIEKEEKLQHELRIKGMDFHLDEKFLNFEDPPAEVFPAREEPEENRFTIKQLESLINEFIISSEDGFIKTEYFVDLMMTRTRNANKFADENGVPQTLKNCDRSDYEMIAKSFDLKLTGWVPLKKVAITMCLLSSPVPTDQELKEYKESMLAKKLEDQGASSFIGKNTFIKIPAWFDESERSHDRPNSYPYPRVKNLKSIIFDIMRNEDFLLNIGEYINMLTIKLPGRDVKVYGDVITAASK